MEGKGECSAPQSLSGTQAPPIVCLTVPRAFEASTESSVFGWQISKETSTCGGSYWRLLWARPGCGTRDFHSYPKDQTSLTEEEASKGSFIMIPGGEKNGFLWTHTLCHPSAYCGLGVHIHFQYHGKFTSKLSGPLYRDLLLSDWCIYARIFLSCFSPLSPAKF